MLSAATVIAAPLDIIGAPGRRFAHQSVCSVPTCSSGACLGGAGFAARDLGSRFSVQFRHIRFFIRPSVFAVDRLEARSEASRGAGAPEPKERS